MKRIWRIYFCCSDILGLQMKTSHKQEKCANFWPLYSKTPFIVQRLRDCVGLRGCSAVLLRRRHWKLLLQNPYCVGDAIRRRHMSHVVDCPSAAMPNKWLSGWITECMCGWLAAVTSHRLTDVIETELLTSWPINWRNQDWLTDWLTD